MKSIMNANKISIIKSMKKDFWKKFYYNFKLQLLKLFMISLYLVLIDDCINKKKQLLFPQFK